MLLFSEQPDSSMTVGSQSGLVDKRIDPEAIPIAGGNYVSCHAGD
jgi:hypothetical protein